MAGGILKLMASVTSKRMDIMAKFKSFHFSLGWLLYIFGKIACITGAKLNRLPILF